MKDLLKQEMQTKTQLPKKVTESLYGAATLENAGYANEYLKLVEMHNQMPKIVQKNIEARLTEENLNTLQWAKEFMERYERKHMSGTWKE